MELPSSSSTSSRKMSSSSTISTTKGVQKLYTKIRHKIEDIPPRITAKLNKTSKHNAMNSVQTKPIAAPRASKRHQIQNFLPKMDLQPQYPKRKQLASLSSSLSSSSSLSDSTLSPISPPTYENIRISTNPNGNCLDSDEECRMSLNNSTISLEDEIFEELEKVAHDEAKLNAVLKNFDKILADFNATNQTIIKMSQEPKSIPIDIIQTKPEPIKKDLKPDDNTVKHRRGSIGKNPHKQLQKSKTCSIIESRCILKKSISEPNGECNEKSFQSLTNNLQHYSAFQVTKSLWNLQDFETFAKSGKNFEKFDYKLPSLKNGSGTNSNNTTCKTFKPTKPNENVTKQVIEVNCTSKNDQSIQPIRIKSNLPRAKSVWELSSTAVASTSSSPSSSLCLPGQHPICIRTSSGSKIPVKKFNPQKLLTNGRSNSFCNETSIIAATTKIAVKTFQTAAKIPPTLQKRTNPGRNTTNSVNRIIRNMNEINIEGGNTTKSSSSSIKLITPLTRTSSSLSSTSIMIGGSSNALNNKKRTINSASSTPHSLHKIGITSKVPSIVLSSSSSSSASTLGSSSATSSAITATKLTIKSAKSELTLNKLKATTTTSTIATKKFTNQKFIQNSTTNNNINVKKQQSDALLNKCLEKGQAILRKVEAFGSVTKLETLSPTNAYNLNKRDVILSSPTLPSITKLKRFGSRDDIVVANNKVKLDKPSTTTVTNTPSCPEKLMPSSSSVSKTDIQFKDIKVNKQQNYRLVVANKKPANNTNDNSSSSSSSSSSLSVLASSSSLHQSYIKQQQNSCTNLSDNDYQENISKTKGDDIVDGYMRQQLNAVDTISNDCKITKQKNSNDSEINDNSKELMINNKMKLSSNKQEIKSSLMLSTPSLVSITSSKSSFLSSSPSASSPSSSSLSPSSSSAPIILYAQEATVKYPRLESCKIIPPLLGHPAQHHAELLVNVKAMQQSLRVHQDSMLCINSDIVRNEKEYQSDCSDDSGHISNENDELININGYNNIGQKTRIDGNGINKGISTSINKIHPKGHKSTKISELLEKFEPITTKPSSSTSSSFGTISKKNIEDGALLGNSKKNFTTIKIAEIKQVNSLKSSLEIYPTYNSEVLFRSGVLSQLEAKRDELLSDRIVQLQSYCRGYLARRRVAQRRVQELAVRCIQRNVRAFLAVRDWPWWRLLVRVTPLLNVHRTEEQLKIANDELQTLRTKLEKFENDRNALKTENDKLEAKLSEMTVDLTEERSAANITSERLEAETAERLKLEKELQEQQSKVKNLQETSEKLEMELICAKSDLNGISEDEDPDNDEGGGVYKLKYERVARELEFTKRRLQTQHEHDLEQLVGLKKQLEKKLADAYEEVEEQRQVVGQWKRKAQKMTNEMNDLRMLLEEQNSRNNLLEKKQRKFDAECQSLQDAARQERQAKDRLSREKDVLIAEKFTLEQNLADARLELELKEEKLSALQRDIEEVTFGGGTEEEVAQLRRSKMDLERRLKEQEEELDDMAGQVQLLEQAKLRLEMTLETVRKEARREAQQRDEELEEARGSSYKKIKALECQLETEHEERTLLLREKHELERRLQAMEEQDRCDRAAEEATNQKLRRDIRKYKALLKDAHSQLERAKADSPGKALIRQLRNQLEDAESARSIAMKARQSAEAELADVQASLEDAQRARSEAEDKSATAQRDRVELQAQIEENEEEMSELMKKYSATVKQLNSEQNAMSEYEIRISELEAERNSLKEQVAELQTRLENIENMSDPSAAVQSKRFELRAKELESRLELEQATRARLEIQSNRHKDALEKLQNEISQSKIRELQAQDALKKAQKCLRELREEFHMVSNREQECTTRRKDLEKKLEGAEAESASLRSDLRLALQRIADLQQAMEEGDEDVTESDDSESTEGSLSDIEQRLRLIQTKRPSTSTPISTVSTKDTNGLSDTSLVIKEKKGENSPRITITSPGSTTKGEASVTLKNGDTSFA